jgi:tetratricopeptide (TPR) repeat protein
MSTLCGGDRYPQRPRVPLFTPKILELAKARMASAISPRARAGMAGLRQRAVLCSLTVVFVLCGTAVGQSPAGQTGDIQSHLRKARESLKANAADRAASEYRAVIELDPSNVEAQANLGVLAFFQGDCQSASRYFGAALKIQPELAKPQALLGICEKRLGEPAARGLLEKSFSSLTDPKLRAQVGMELAGLYYQEGDLHRAAPLIQSLVDLEPDNVDILYSAQLLYSELADETLNKLAVVAPGSARMQQVIGEKLINAGDLNAAAEHFKKAIEMDARLPGVRYEMSQAILESAQPDAKVQAEAQSLLQAEIKVAGDNAKIECEMGAIALLQSDSERAYAHYQKAFALNPKDVEAEMGLAKLLTAQGKAEDAMKLLRMAVEGDPLSSDAHYRLALVYRDLHRTDDARNEMRLFQDIKKTRDEVKALYKQMNKQPKDRSERTDDVPKDH